MSDVALACPITDKASVIAITKTNIPKAILSASTTFSMINHSFYFYFTCLIVTEFINPEASVPNETSYL